MSKVIAICFLVLAILGGCFVWDFYNGSHATATFFAGVLHFINCCVDFVKALFKL